MRKKKILIYTFTALIIALCLAWFYLAQVNQPLPHKEKIESFLDSLTYTSLIDLLREDTNITFDFTRRAWIINNIFYYEEDGNIINLKTNTGVCTELSEIAYHFLKPLFEEDYYIYFVIANEDKFFSSADNLGATHFLIRLSPKEGFFKKQRTIGVDATYKKYDYLRNFSGYRFNKRFSRLPAFEDKEKDIMLHLNVQYPLIFSKDRSHLLSMVVKETNDKFDQDNYALMVYATPEHSHRGKAVLAFIRNEGNNEFFRHEQLLNELLDAEEQKLLVFTLGKQFSNIRYSSP